MNVNATRVARRYVGARIDTGIEYTSGPRLTTADIERIIAKRRAIVPGTCSSG
jgi:hypothetical protein